MALMQVHSVIFAPVIGELNGSSIKMWELSVTLWTQSGHAAIETLDTRRSLAATACCKSR
eukprot:5251262-Amphidinium_carterae.1